MSSDATAAANSSANKTDPARPDASPADKGKGKGKFVAADTVDDDDDDDEEEDEDEDDDDDMDEEDELDEIDPSVILGSRRTRGVRVDYTSKEALEKAGLKPEAADDDDVEESFEARDEDMHDD
ncbi:hypothetical protein B0H21DRAFT_820500 [Amylocystis lapponica]|nr:hypothetical protein B0H21DRAFT_820500 [Amylocystis lapponica]